MAQLEENYGAAKMKLRIEIDKSEKQCWDRICSEIYQDQWGLGYRIVIHQPRKTQTKNITLKVMKSKCRKLFHTYVDTLWTRHEGGEAAPLATDGVTTARNKINPKKNLPTRTVFPARKLIY